MLSVFAMPFLHFVSRSRLFFFCYAIIRKKNIWNKSIRRTQPVKKIQQIFSMIRIHTWGPLPK